MAVGDGLRLFLGRALAVGFAASKLCLRVGQVQLDPVENTRLSSADWALWQCISTPGSGSLELRNRCRLWSK